jgi:D-3-phosphoglycerate dehydrogenase
MDTPFRVLIADKMSPRASEILNACDVIECDDRAGISAEELEGSIEQYHGLLVRSRTKVTSAVLSQAKNLKLIGRAGIGVDNIDVEAATQRDIIVENAPNGNAITTAEHAICLLLSLLRNIPRASSSMKQNKWEKKQLQGTEIFSKTFGVIGLGNIGKIVAELGAGLKMKVVAADPVVSEEQAKALGVELVSLDELLSRADFISLHTPLNDKTRGLLGESEFAKMKPGAFLVNASRGGIVDEAACLAALESGRLAGAAFDVFLEEPPKADDPLVMHEKVVCTPHLGASTAEAQVKVAEEVANQMVLFATKGEVRNALNVGKS